MLRGRGIVDFLPFFAVKTSGGSGVEGDGGIGVRVYQVPAICLSVYLFVYRYTSKYLFCLLYTSDAADE